MCVAWLGVGGGGAYGEWIFHGAGGISNVWDSLDMRPTTRTYVRIKHPYVVTSAFHAPPLGSNSGSRRLIELGSKQFFCKAYNHDQRLDFLLSGDSFPRGFLF